MTGHVVARAVVPIYPQIAKGFATSLKADMKREMASAADPGSGDAFTKPGKESAKKFGAGFKSALGPVMAVASVGAVASFAKGMVDDFAELEDSTAAAAVIFGESMGKITEQGETAAETLGLAKQQVINAANTFGTYGKAAELAGDDLATFSTDLTGLAADMASFKGKRPEDAIEAIGAALRGENEPIRAFGVMLDEATLKATAMSMGLLKVTKDTDKIKEAQTKATLAQRAYNEAVKKYGEDSDKALRAEVTMEAAQRALAKATEGSIGPLTAQQKILAAQQAIFEQTTDAQGDFARTSESTANTQKRLQATVADLSAEIGAKLAPAIVAAQEAGLTLIQWASDNQATLVPLVTTIAGAVVVIKGLHAARDAAASVDFLRDAIKRASDAADSLGGPGGVGKLGKLATFMTGPWGVAFAAGAVAVGVLAKEHLDAEARIRGYTDAIIADSGALGENTRATAMNTLEKSGAARAAAQLGISMSTLVDAALGDESAMKAVAATTNRAAEGHKNVANATEDVIRQYDMNAEAAAILKRQMGATRGEIEQSKEAADRHAEGLKKVDKSAQAVIESLAGIKSKDVTIDVHTRLSANTKTYLAAVKSGAINPAAIYSATGGKGHAAGGAIYGPGSGTSDSIAAWLSNGEHVLTADDVKDLGGQEAVYRMRQMAQSGRLRFAEGGAVGTSGSPSLGGGDYYVIHVHGVTDAEAVEALLVKLMSRRGVKPATEKGLAFL